MGAISFGLGAVYMPGMVTEPPALPLLSSGPGVVGEGVENTDLISDESDTWVYGGATASVTNRDYRLLIGGIPSVGPQATPAVTIPTATGGQSYSYEVRASVAEGGGTTSPWIAIATGTVIDALTLNQTTSAEIEISGGQSTTTVTITTPPVYADHDAGNGPGIFILNRTDLDSGPINLVALAIVDDSTPSDGENLTITPGLWVYDSDNTAPLITYQWLRDGVNIQGATANNYTLTSADTGVDIHVRETATDTNGTRAADSAAVSVASSGGTWTAPGITVGDGAVTLTVGVNQHVAPSAPTAVASGGEITLTQA